MPAETVTETATNTATLTDTPTHTPTYSPTLTFIPTSPFLVNTLPPSLLEIQTEECVTAPDTPGIYTIDDAQWYLRYSNTSGFADTTFTYGLPDDMPIVGDWNDDDIDTAGVWRDGTVYYLRNSNDSGLGDLAFSFGLPDDIPVTGDWDGDGIDTIGVYRPGDGLWFLNNSNDSGTADVTFAFGLPDDVPVAGDWDGDGIDTIGIYRPNDGLWFLRNSNSSGFADVVVTFGLSSDTPITGDWDGNCQDSIGVYRSGDTWLLKNELVTGTADIVFGYGLPGFALTGKWQDGTPPTPTPTPTNTLSPTPGNPPSTILGETYSCEFLLGKGVADWVNGTKAGHRCTIPPQPLPVIAWKIEIDWETTVWEYGYFGAQHLWGWGSHYSSGTEYLGAQGIGIWRWTNLQAVGATAHVRVCQGDSTDPFTGYGAVVNAACDAYAPEPGFSHRRAGDYYRDAWAQIKYEIALQHQGFNQVHIVSRWTPILYGDPLVLTPTPTPTYTPTETYTPTATATCSPNGVTGDPAQGGIGVMSESCVIQLSPSPASPTPTPTYTLTHSPTVDPPGCIVYTMQEVDVFLNPIDARTVRYSLDQGNGNPVIPLEQPIQTFAANTQLRLTARYMHGGHEEFVYLVHSYRTVFADIHQYDSANWQWIPTAAWISTKPNRDQDANGIADAIVELVDDVTFEDCTGLVDMQNPIPARAAYEETIEDIRDYGVDVRENGMTWDESGSIDPNDPLQEPTHELQELLAGIQRTAEALDYLSSEPTLHKSFRKLMIPPITVGNPIIDYFLFIRADRDEDDCLTDNDPLIPNLALVRVTCGYMRNSNNLRWLPYGKIEEEAVIHELGHVFDARTNGALHAAVDGAAILGCNGLLVMGRLPGSNEWERKQLGWGSGPGMSRFQLNTFYDSYLYPNQDDEVEEAMADMFLNWVYRRTTDHPGQVPSVNICTDGIHQIRGTWDGFLNVDWDSGQDDSLTSQSGNRRYLWMEQQLDSLIS